jgi:hypothetical protein
MAVIHVNDFKWFSQCRGQPTVAAAILDWYDLAETRDAEKGIAEGELCFGVGRVE